MVFLRFINWYTGRLTVAPTITRSISAGILLGIGDTASQYFIEERKDWSSFQISRTVQMTGYGLLVLGPILHGWYSTMDRVMVAERILKGKFRNPIFLFSSRLLSAQQRFALNRKVATANASSTALKVSVTCRRPFDLLVQHMPINALIRIAIDQVTISPATILLFFVAMTSATMIREKLTDNHFQWSSQNVAQLSQQCYERSYDRVRFSFWDTYVNGLKVWPLGQIFNFTLVPPLYRVLYANCISFCWNAYLSYKQQESIVVVVVDNDVKEDVEPLRLTVQQPQC